jgi:RNA polymerase sigma-70 factor (ECF subfamily)
MSSRIRSFECVLRAWQNHESELLAYLTRRIGNKEIAEDLLHEVFLKSLRQGMVFCSLENPRAWLFKVARTTLIDHARLRKVYGQLSEDLAAPQAEARAPVDELDACLLRNLAEMAPDDRDIIDQCDLQGVKQKDYASANGLSLSAAKARLSRARYRLRAALTVNYQVRFDETGRVCCHVPRAPIS